MSTQNSNTTFPCVHLPRRLRSHRLIVTVTEKLVEIIAFQFFFLFPFTVPCFLLTQPNRLLQVILVGPKPSTSAARYDCILFVCSFSSLTYFSRRFRASSSAKRLLSAIARCKSWSSLSRGPEYWAISSGLYCRRPIASFK